MDTKMLGRIANVLVGGLMLPTLIALIGYAITKDTRWLWGLAIGLFCLFALFVTEVFETRIFFKEEIGVNPPDRYDWQAMKIVQQLVDRKAAEYKKKKQEIFERENDFLKLQEVTPEAAKQALSAARSVKEQVRIVKAEWNRFEAAMKHFGFNV